MKKISLILLSMALHFSGMCQDSLVNLNCLIKVDDKIVKVGIADCSLNVMDNKGSLKQLSFEYEVGRIKIKKEDFVLLRNMSNTKALLEFSYSQICPNAKEYTYKFEMDLDFLFQRYLIIDIFNLDKKRSSRIFGGKSGYVFDIEIPSRKIATPRKKKEKDGC
ncbi:MAG: hypothetical protein WD512_19245 [Candidatus Paceibacterota bacterium]